MWCAQFWASRFNCQKATGKTGNRDWETEVKTDRWTYGNIDARSGCGRYNYIGGGGGGYILKTLYSDIFKVYLGYPANLSTWYIEIISLNVISTINILHIHIYTILMHRIHTIYTPYIIHHMDTISILYKNCIDTTYTICIFVSLSCRSLYGCPSSSLSHCPVVHFLVWRSPDESNQPPIFFYELTECDLMLLVLTLCIITEHVQKTKTNTQNISFMGNVQIQQ